MKRSILAIFLACLLVIGSFNISFASTTIEMTVEDSTISYDDATGGSNDIISGNRVLLEAGDYEVFTLDITQAGDYSLLFSSVCTTADTQIKVSVKSGAADFTDALTATVETGSAFSDTVSTFGTIALPSGSVSLKFEAVSGSCKFTKFSIEIATAFAVEDIKATADETVVEENSVIPRSTSFFDIGFTGSTNTSTITAESIKLLKGAEAVEASITPNSTGAVLALVSTLEYDTEYTLLINGVSNLAGSQSISNYSVTFKTSTKEADSGEAQVTADNALLTGRSVAITGKLTDESGRGVAGREVKLYYTPYGGTETTEPVKTVLTSEDGVFSLSYSIEKSAQSGDYGFKVVGEYMQEPKNYTIAYDAEAAMAALTQVINVTQHNAAQSSPQTEGIIRPATGDPYISFNGYPQDKQVFDIVIPESGTYAISMLAGTGADAKLTVSYLSGQYSGTEEDWTNNSVIIKEFTTISTGGTSTFAYQPVGAVELEEGPVKIRFAITYSDIHFSGFEIKYLNPATVSEVSANGESLLSGGIAKRGTDVLEIAFTERIDTSLEGSSVTLKDESGKALKVEAEAADNILKLHLLESFDYSTSYTLNVSGIKDMFGAYEAEELDLVFATGDAQTDSGAAEITEASGTADYADMSVSAKMLSSTQKPIGGRNYEIYLKDPAGNVSVEPIKKGKTGTQGEIEANITMGNDDLGGIYTFIFKGDYVTQEPEVELIYVSRSMEQAIAEEIRNAQNAEEARAVIEENETNLGLDIDSDMAAIGETSYVYGHIAGASVSTIDEIRERYRAAIALETINQATAAEPVRAVFEDAQACEDLGLDKSRIDILTGGNKDTFIADILALDRIESISDASQKVEEMLNKNLAIQLGKTAVASAATNVTVEAGSGAGVALSLAEAISDVKRITFYIEADSYLLANASVTINDGTHTKSLAGNVMTVVIEKNTGFNNVSDFGMVYLSTKSEAGTENVKLSADILYSKKLATTDTSVVEVTNIMEEKVITVTTTEKQKADTPSRPSSSSASGTSRGQSVVTPVLPEIQPTEEPLSDVPPSDGELVFNDLDEAEWAKEAVIELYENGIVSKSDDKRFNPNVNVKREELVKMVVLACGVYNETAACSFTDVSEDSWYYSFVASALEAGIITGRDDGTFGSGDNITRQEMATIVYRAFSAKLPKAQYTELFSDDGEIAQYAREAVYSLKEQNVINGMGDNLFVPLGAVTRAMAAKVIAGMIK